MQKSTTQAGRTARRGKKVEALKDMRGDDLSSDKLEANPKEARGRARKVRSRIAAGTGDQRDRRLKLATKLRGVLVKTPDDGSGKIPDTPFTKAGVARVMELLSKRAGDAGSTGGKVAGNMVKFLSAEAGEDAVAGASVKKLQMLAKRTEKLKTNIGPKLRKG